MCITRFLFRCTRRFLIFKKKNGLLFRRDIMGLIDMTWILSLTLDSVMDSDFYSKYYSHGNYSRDYTAFSARSTGSAKLSYRRRWISSPDKRTWGLVRSRSHAELRTAHRHLTELGAPTHVRDPGAGKGGASGGPARCGVGDSRNRQAAPPRRPGRPRCPL